MDIPKEIDLLDWTDYAIFRSLIKKPFPSPRVWDNAGTMGFSGGNFQKDFFFDSNIFSTQLKRTTREKYGGEMRSVNSNYGRILKSDGNLHTFCEAKDVGHLYLNFENFLVSQSLSLDIDYQGLRDAIRDIYYLVRVQNPSIDSGFIAPLYGANFSEYPNNSEYDWIKINKKLGVELNKNKNLNIDFLFNSISSIFGISSEKLCEISEKLENDIWFFEMFKYSFRDRYLKNIYSLKKQEIIKSQDFEEGEVEILKNGEIEIVKSEPIKSQSKKSSLDKLYENDNQNNLRFIPSEAKIPSGFKSLGDEIKDLEFAIHNPLVSFRSFFNDCEFLINGNWREETLFCQAFNEELYCQLIKEYHRFSIAELNSMKAEEMKKAERKGAGIGGLLGLMAGGIMAPITAAMGANVGKMISNNVDVRKPLKDFLPEPYLVFLKDQGSYLSLSKTYKGRTTKRRICFKKNYLDDDFVYFDLIPMIVFDDWVTPAQIFKLENSYYFRPISANYDLNNEFNLEYNPIKYRRSYSYNPRKEGDVEKIARVMTTKISGETIEKTPTIFHAWLRDDESFKHFYFDYSTDGTVF